MNSEQQPNEEEFDPLEDSDLARRLRNMQWPAAPPDVKQRCLDEILSQVGAGEQDD